MIEVELKARVRDRASVIAAVSSFARAAGEVDKRDSYWRAPGWRTAGGRSASGFRLRREDGAAIVNFKTKREEGGIEVNRETEFSVSDAGAFESLALRLGCETHYEKRKTGLAFKAGGDGAWPYEATIEVVEVLGLGDFIEIEVLLEAEDPAALAEARGEIRAVLERSGLAEADIEPRFYSDLLAEAGGREPLRS